MINVKHLPFGAKGDGVTDDRLAIQDAIDTAFEDGIDRTIFVPAGTYIIGSDSDSANQPLVIRSNIRLIGEGVGHTILRLPDNASQSSPNPSRLGPPFVGNFAVLLINEGHMGWFGDGTSPDSPPLPPATNNIEIAQMTLDANRDGQPIIYPGASVLSGNFVGSACSLSQTSNAYLHDLELRNSADSGLLLIAGLATLESGVTNSRFERLWIHHSGWAAVSISGEASDLTFDGCVIENNDNQAAAITFT